MNYRQDDTVAQLERLVRLRDSGALTEGEFQSQKARLLAGGARPAGPAPGGGRFGFQSAADAITGGLGLSRIERFSLGHFFSDVFRRHEQDEMENLLSVGAPGTTPPLNATMGNFPNPWIFFRAFMVSIGAWVIFYLGWRNFQNDNLVPGLVMIGSFAVPLSVLILFFELNTPRNVSLARLMQFLLLGGSASLFLALILFDVTKLTESFGASAAGIVEECGKLAAVMLATQMAAKGRYPYLLNYILFGAAVGTGFAAFESAGYALRIGLSGGMDALTGSLFIRGILSPFGHIIWTAIAAAAWRRANGNLLSGSFLRLFIVPVALHFIWNSDLQLPYFGTPLLLGFVGWVVLLSLVQSGLREVAHAAGGGEAPSTVYRSRRL